MLLYSTKVVDDKNKFKFINLFQMCISITGPFYLLKSAYCSAA